MEGFTKLHAQIITSTIWRAPDHVRLVWITMLALKTRHGEVLASVPGLAAVANVTLENCIDAIAHLSSPDEYSRTKDFDGRRIQEIDGGWYVLNHSKYRALASKEEYLEREAQRKREARSSAAVRERPQASGHVRNRPQPSAVERKRPPIADTDPNSDPEEETDPSTLRVSGSHTHAREPEPKGIADLGRHVRLAFAARYASARAGASLPQTPANAKSLAAITEWCRDTANARSADAFGLATQLVDAFFASQKASGAGFRPSWLAQDPLEYLEPSQSRAAEPKGAASHVSTTFDESNNPEWAR